MAITRRTLAVSIASTGIITASFAAFHAIAQGTTHMGDHSTPKGSPEVLGCVVPSASPGSTPEANIPFDQAYIDMMIPHHESVLVLAEKATDQVKNERLVVVAQAILDTQAVEIDELKALRKEWYGDPEPTMMNDEIMAVSMGMQHGCAEQGHMDQMDSNWQLEQFAAAKDKDLAFINQVIPHHQMAIDVSEIALEQAEHQEIIDIAKRVIAAQEAEITELEEIRTEIEG